MTIIYAVEFTANGKTEISKFFTKIAAARKWAKWLRTASYIQSVRIMKGGQGGQEVA